MSLIENEDGWIVAFHSHNYNLMSRHGWSSLIANYLCDLLSKTINIHWNWVLCDCDQHSTVA